MGGEFLSPQTMRDVVTSALLDFSNADMELLHVGVQEETLAHRVAVYIERRLDGWQVDCEYNRNRRVPKMRLDGANRMRPDIIAHIRNTTRNLLVVEIKKTSHSKKKKEEARERVIEMTGKWSDFPRYCHGVVLTFPVRSNDPKKVGCEWFHRDGCSALNGGAPQTGTLDVPLTKQV